MYGFLSNKHISPNEIEQKRSFRLKKGLEVLDLTCTNPTKHGFIFPKHILIDSSANYLKKRNYQPDSKGCYEARESISQYYIPRLNIPPSDIFITSSTSESYGLLLSLLCSPGDNVVTTTVSYPLIEMIAEAHHIEVKTIDNADSKTRAIILISPENPTGIVINKSENKIKELSLPIIADEVFCEFNYSSESIPAIGTIYPNHPVFHLNGISKMFALPDLKLGWIALNKKAIEDFSERLEILNDTFLNCSYLVQGMLPSIFENGKDFLLHYKEAIARNIRESTEIINNSSFLTTNKPDGGMYLCIKLPRKTNEEDVVLFLLDQGIYVHPGYFYGLEDGYIIISCLAKRELNSHRINRLVSELRKFFS